MKTPHTVCARNAAEILAAESIHFYYTNILEVGAAAEKLVKQEAEGTHADEIETSLMLYMYPRAVNMKKAAKDIHPRNGAGPLVRVTGKPAMAIVSASA